MSERQTRRSIRSKILTRTILLSLVPLLVLGGAAIVSLRGLQDSVDDAISNTESDLADEVAGRSLRQDAAELGLQLERYAGERISDIAEWSDAPVVQDATAGGGTAEAQRFLESRIASDGSPFLALALTDASGDVVIGVDGSVPADPDVSWIQTALADGGIMSPVDLYADIPYMDVALRVESPDGETLGTLWGALDAKFFQSVADSYRLDKDSDVHVSVFTRDGALMAETASDNAERRLFDTELVRTPEQQFFFDRAVATDAEDDMSPSEGYSVQAGDFAAHGFVNEIPVGLRNGLVIRADWITEVQEPASKALDPLAATDQVPTSLSSSLRTVFLAIALAVFVAFLTSLIVGRVLARNIVRPITRLRDEADSVAGDRLPATVAAVADGGDPPPAVPIDVGSDDEVAELADSFNEVQSTAIDLAADQAILRRNFSDLFVYLGRRNQNLLGRQLELIDELERNEDDAELLASLFDLDHLATRMRRNAESLLVIAGREPTRTWTQPVAVRDVVRGASSEVQDYARVRLGQFADAFLRGESASDIAHLLAELVENALRYSPPTSTVTLCGQPYRQNAYAISVSDEGLGLDEEALTAINDDLEAAATGDDPERIPTSSLGLFVVGRLARRHGCQVRLTSGAKGTVAWVLLPPSLLAEDPSRQAPDEAAAPEPPPSPSVAQPEPQPPVQPKPQPVAQPEPQPPVQPKPQPVAQPEPQPPVQPEPQVQPPAEPQPPVEPMAHPTPQPRPAVAQPEQQPPVQPQPQPQAQPEPVAGTPTNGSPGAPADNGQPSTMVEALTLQPAAPEKPPGSADPAARPLAGGGADGEEPPVRRTRSGFTRRVSRNRRGPKAGSTPTSAPQPDPARPQRRRSAEDVGNRLRAFQDAVARGRDEQAATDEDQAPEGEGL